MRNYKEVKSQNEYLRKQLAKSMSSQRKNLQSTPSCESSAFEQNHKEAETTPLLPLVTKVIQEREEIKETPILP